MTPNARDAVNALTVYDMNYQRLFISFGLKPLNIQGIIGMKNTKNWAHKPGIIRTTLFLFEVSHEQNEWYRILNKTIVALISITRI